MVANMKVIKFQLFYKQLELFTYVLLLFWYHAVAHEDGERYQYFSVQFQVLGYVLSV